MGGKASCHSNSQFIGQIVCGVNPASGGEMGHADIKLMRASDLALDGSIQAGDLSRASGGGEKDVGGRGLSCSIL